jgi:hypothetical protein
MRLVPVLIAALLLFRPAEAADPSPTQQLALPDGIVLVLDSGLTILAIVVPVVDTATGQAFDYTVTSGSWIGVSLAQPPILGPVIPIRPAPPVTLPAIALPAGLVAALTPPASVGGFLSSGQ